MVVAVHFCFITQAVSRNVRKLGRTSVVTGIELNSQQSPFCSPEPKPHFKNGCGWLPEFESRQNTLNYMSLLLCVDFNRRSFFFSVAEPFQ